MGCLPNGHEEFKDTLLTVLMQYNNDRTLRLLVHYIYHFDFFVFVQVISCTCLHGVVGKPFKTILQWNLYFYRHFLSVSLYAESLDPRVLSNNF